MGGSGYNSGYKVLIKYIFDDDEKNLGLYFLYIVIWNVTIIIIIIFAIISRTSAKSSRQHGLDRDLLPFDTPDESILDLL